MKASGFYALPVADNCANCLSPPSWLLDDGFGVLSFFFRNARKYFADAHVPLFKDWLLRGSDSPPRRLMKLKLERNAGFFFFFFIVISLRLERVGEEHLSDEPLRPYGAHVFAALAKRGEIAEGRGTKRGMVLRTGKTKEQMRVEIVLRRLKLLSPWQRTQAVLTRSANRTRRN